MSVAEPVIDNTLTRVQTPLCVAMRQIGTLHPKAEGFRVLKVKTAYYAIQNAVSVFNDDFESLAEKSTSTIAGLRRGVAYDWRHLATGLPAVVFWEAAAQPSENWTAKTVEVRVKSRPLANPVWGDLLSGNVYEIDPGDMVSDGDWTVYRVPAYDSPTFVTDRSLLQLDESWFVRGEAAGIGSMRPFGFRTVFADHMVLQREKPVRISGTGPQGMKVAAEFRGERCETQIDTNGEWCVSFRPGEAGGPFEISATLSDGRVRRLNDVWVGEVWVASGQSNMDMPVWGKGEHYRLPDGEAVAAAANDAKMRLLHLSHKLDVWRSHKDLPDGSAWKIANEADSVKPFSATAWWFGRCLREQFGADMPIGLIDASWGGSRIEPWTPSSHYRAEKKPSMEDWLKQFLASDPKTSQNAIRDWSRPDLDLAGWKRGPRSAMSGLSRPGIAWYRFDFDVSPVQADQELIFVADYVNDADEAYVDGRLIGYTLPGEVKDWWSAPRRYSFKVGAGRHTLAIRAMDHMGVGLIGPKLGLHDAGGKLVRDFSDGEWCERVEFRADIAKIGERPSVDAPMPFTTPSALWNAMVAPVAEMNIRGAIWYQGCANAGEASAYPERERQLIDGWRVAFRDPAMPFIVTQISSLFKNSPGNPGPSDAWKAVAPEAQLGFAEIRAAQEKMHDYPQTGLACTIDIGDMYDIHPKNKKEVGRRLCHEAMRVAYGKPSFAPGPRVGSVRREGPAVVVTVKDAGEGLVCKGGKVNPHLFELADERGDWHWAEATLGGKDELRVTCDKVANPTKVRWCWSGYPPEVNVYRKGDGLPLFPFEHAVE